jgi:hypothetical protein
MINRVASVDQKLVAVYWMATVGIVVLTLAEALSGAE